MHLPYLASIFVLGFHRILDYKRDWISIRTLFYENKNYQ